MVGLVLFAVVVLLIEFYCFIAVKNVFTKIVTVVYSVFSILAVSYFVYTILSFDRANGINGYWLQVMSLVVLYLVTKFFIALPMLITDIFFGLIYVFKINNNTLFNRSKKVAILSLGISVIPFLSVLFGITFGKYNFKVKEEEVKFSDLPTEFDGLRVMHLSDIHAGSLYDHDQIKKAVDLINSQDFDVLVFTGDLVNNFDYELDPLYDILSKIKVPEFGKFSVLGNHDYGGYTIWKSETDKEKNFQGILNAHTKLGFTLLNNEHKLLVKNNDTIALVGVENWGLRFIQKGDLNKALDGLSNDKFKVLLSHDPSHFDNEVKQHLNKVHLTLSGHTHGMQFGVEIPNVFKWSPVQYVYEKWAGLYQDSGRYLYVNRGFGFHAYSGRVGIWPEITILELKKE